MADALARIEWPEGVSGCALVVERVVLPAAVESGLQDAESDAELARLAGSDPRRHEVRMVAGVLREGDRFGAVRLRSHDEDSGGADRRRLGPYALPSTVIDIRAVGGERTRRWPWGRRQQ